jgi:hypothetical protein
VCRAAASSSLQGSFSFQASVHGVGPSILSWRLRRVHEAAPIVDGLVASWTRRCHTCLLSATTESSQQPETSRLIPQGLAGGVSRGEGIGGSGESVAAWSDDAGGGE